MTLFPKTLIAAICFVILANATSARAQTSSLWQRRDPRITNQFADVKARRPGDLLVIRINEQSNVQNKDQRTMQKQTTASSDGSISAGGTDGIEFAKGGLEFDQSSDSNRNFKGNTQFKSQRAFIDQFTVMIIDVTPNGNLLVSGTRHVALEGDRRTLVLTGSVRAVDILPDNSIPSQNVANLDIRYASSAAVDGETHYLNNGWLGKKINFAWPY